MVWRWILVVALICGSAAGQDIGDPSPPILRDDSGLWSMPDGVEPAPGWYVGEGLTEGEVEPLPETNVVAEALYLTWLVFTFQWGVD